MVQELTWEPIRQQALRHSNFKLLHLNVKDCTAFYVMLLIMTTALTDMDLNYFYSYSNHHCRSAQFQWLSLGSLNPERLLMLILQEEAIEITEDFLISHLCLLSILGCLTNQENSQRGCLGFLGDVDDLLEPGYSQGYVLGWHTSVMESVQCHLSGRLSQRLSSQGTHHLTRCHLQM